MKLKEGEVTCDKCKGEGKIYKSHYAMHQGQHIEFSMPDMCPKCHGIGKLDWIENIVGKKITLFMEYKGIPVGSLPMVTASQSTGKSMLWLDYIDLIKE